MLEEYDMKKVAIAAGAAALVILTLLTIFSGTVEPEIKPVTQNKYAVQFEDKTFYVPVENVTDDKGYDDGTGNIQFMEGTQWISFSLSGIYKGKRFSNAYLDWSDDGSYDALMAIGREMNPKDGVIEGYIVETFENNTPYAYIYLDEDWKKKVGSTNIIWGKDLQFMQAFEWTKIADGIYMNKIEDDKERFPADLRLRESGIFVGDFTIEDTKQETNGEWTGIKLS